MIEHEALTLCINGHRIIEKDRILNLL